MLPTEWLKWAIVIAIVSLRCSRARLASACVCASFSRSIMVSRNTITVRAMSPISSRACGRRNARRGVAGGEPFHHSGEAVQRAGDAAADQPAKAEAEQDHGDADGDDARRVSRLRDEQRDEPLSDVLRACSMILSARGSMAGCRYRSARAADAVVEASPHCAKVSA